MSARGLAALLPEGPHAACRAVAYASLARMSTTVKLVWAARGQASKNASVAGHFKALNALMLVEATQVHGR